LLTKGYSLDLNRRTFGLLDEEGDMARIRLWS
jgi:hypothetical protein